MPESVSKSIRPKFLAPKSNTVFQLLFGDPRNIDLLADFLKAVMNTQDDEYQDIVIVNPYLTREYPDKKLGIVDLRITTRSGQIIHVEIQRDHFFALRNRVVFYVSSLITGQIGEGDKYGGLKRAVSIVITNHELITESPRYHHRFTLYDSSAAVEFTDLFEIRTLELPKIPKTPDVYLWHWLRFFSAETKEELEMVATASPAIRKATARVLKLSKDERARMLYEAELKAWRDEQAKLGDAELKGRTEGRTEGRAEGRKEERVAIAQNLRKMKMPFTKISKATGFTIDEIKKITY